MTFVGAIVRMPYYKLLESNIKVIIEVTGIRKAAKINIVDLILLLHHNIANTRHEVHVKNLLLISLDKDINIDILQSTVCMRCNIDEIVSHLIKSFFMCLLNL